MLDMLDHVSQPFNTQPAGGVSLILPATDGYYDYDNGGAWVPGASPDPVAVLQINIQPAGPKAIEQLVQMGGTANPRDIREVWINDGVTYLQPEDTGRPADVLEFDDGIATRQWRVMKSDNRPWHNYCHAIVERIRDSAV